jgi:hypothetical protein
MTNTLTDCITDAITVGSGSYDRQWAIIPSWTWW